LVGVSLRNDDERAAPSGEADGISSSLGGSTGLTRTDTWMGHALILGLFAAALRCSAGGKKRYKAG